MNEIFNSEFYEDTWIAANVELPAHGVYVDVGCAHPIQFSNTVFLRRRGWTGISIDGNPAYGPEWAELAPGAVFVPAVLAARRRVKFEIVPENSAVSRLSKTGVSCRAQTLEEVLEAHTIGKIDFLSLDIEGAEFDVFLTLDLEKHQPGVIVAEYNTQGIGEDFRLRDYLVATGLYEVRHQTVANFIYILKSEKFATLNIERSTLNAEVRNTRAGALSRAGKVECVAGRQPERSGECGEARSTDRCGERPLPINNQPSTINSL